MKKLIVLLSLVALTATLGVPAAERDQRAQASDKRCCASYAPTLPPAAGTVPGTTDVLFESFEGTFPPTGWTKMTSGESYEWEQTSGQAYSGSYGAFVQYGDTGTWQDEWLVTEAVDTTGVSHLYLEIHETGAYWSGYGLEHEILVSTTVPGDPGAFTSVLSMTPDTYPAEWLDSAGTWGAIELDLSAYAGLPTVYVAVRYQGEYADTWYIDDIRLYEPFDHDVAAIEVLPDGDVWTPGQTIVPRLTVKNVGLNTESFDVVLVGQLNGSPFYVQNDTVSNLTPGESTTVDFPSFDAEIGLYELIGSTMLAGDEYTDNDTAFADNGCYSGQRVPLGILITNWGCGPCVQANQALDAYIPTQGNDVALVRVHCWWPSGDDPMYLANTAQCDYLIENTPTGSDYAPHLWLDNYVDAGSDGSGYEDFYEDQKLLGSPLTIALGYDAGTGEVAVTVDVLDPMPVADYVLYVAVTEDGVEALGPNGEPIHNQAFRYLFPDVVGTPVSTDIGVQQFVVPLTFDPEWVFSNLRATAWVQDSAPSGMIMNSATMFLDPARNRMLVVGPGAGAANPPTVRVFPPEQDAAHEYEFTAYGATGYGVNVTCGDVTGDGCSDILTGAGPGPVYGPHVRGFEIDGTPLPGLSFLAYGTNKWGVNVVAGDIDGDGFDEIITGAGPGPVYGPHVRGWDYDGSPGVTPISDVSFFAYGTPKWGVNVAAGDIDGDGFDEIVTGAGPGPVYGPHVRGWNVDGGAVTAMSGVSFFAYGTDKFGVKATCGDLDGDGIDEIATGPGPGQVFGAQVRGWNYDGATLTDIPGFNFFAWDPGEARYGVNVFAGADLNGDGTGELIAGCGPDQNVGTPVKVFIFDGGQVSEWFSLEAFTGLTHGSTVAGGSFQ